MCQRVYLLGKTAVQNIGYVYTCFCGGHKNNFRLQFHSSFKALVFCIMKAPPHQRSTSPTDPEKKMLQGPFHRDIILLLKLFILNKLVAFENLWH